ncbi:signal peptide peptidase-like 2A [Ornithodoros turicata]|uniref:signal peptide peptidase-like 2A n=1 Tax=Ornithodoros turicata TaxID=34597 RepID=UPI003138C339
MSRCMDFAFGHVRLWLVVVAFHMCQAEVQFATLKYTSHGNQTEVCARYYPDFKELPVYPNSLKDVSLTDLTAQSPCNYIRGINLTGKFALVYLHENCSCNEVVQSFENAKPLGVLISVKNISKRLLNECRTKTAKGNMVVLVAAKKFIDTMPRTNEMTGLEIYTWPRTLDPALAIIGSIAVAAVALGAYLSGGKKYEIYLRDLAKEIHRRKTRVIVERKPPTVRDVMKEYDRKMDIKVGDVVTFVAIMAAMLMTLYFLVDYISYLIVPTFAMATTAAVVAVLEPVVYRIPIGTSKLPQELCWCLFEELEVRQAFLLGGALALSISWIIFRHDKISWILQNILGFCFCVSAMKALRMPNLKVIAVFLVMLLFYDAFFVFLTPYLTKDGESVMVKVAKGTEDREKLPATMRVPVLGNQPIAICMNPETMLGYGDILVPGLLVSYCRGFDLINTQESYYYICAVTFYAIGLGVTFVALILMEIAQPALIYLVPATLGSTVILATFRGHLSEMWHGTPPPIPENLDVGPLPKLPPEELGTPPRSRRSRSRRSSSADSNARSRSRSPSRNGTPNGSRSPSPSQSPSYAAGPYARTPDRTPSASTPGHV